MRLFSVVVGVNAVSAHDSDIIERRVIHQFLQGFRVDPVRVHRLSVQVRDGTDAVLRSDEQVSDPLGRLIRRILHIFSISVYRHAAVRVQVSRKTCDDADQENADWNGSFPKSPVFSHKMDSLPNLKSGLGSPPTIFVHDLTLTYLFCFVKVSSSQITMLLIFPRSLSVLWDRLCSILIPSRDQEGFGMLGAVVFAVLYLPLSVIFALTGKYR